MANKIMHHVVIGSDTFEIVDQYAREHGVTIDSTLTQSGQAADAKAVGDAIANFTVEVDDTLSEEGEAADAKATGDAVTELKNELDGITAETRNLFDLEQMALGKNAENTDINTRAISGPIYVGSAKYTISTEELPASLKYMIYGYTGTGFNTITTGLTRWITNEDTVTTLTPSTYSYIRVLFGTVNDANITETDFDGLKLQIELGDTKTEYVNHDVTAVDIIAREAIENFNVEVDTTLTQEGKAADAKATGNAVAELKSEIEEIQNENLTGRIEFAQGGILSIADYSGYSTNNYGTRVRCIANISVPRIVIDQGKSGTSIQVAIFDSAGNLLGSNLSWKSDKYMFENENIAQIRIAIKKVVNGSDVNITPNDVLGAGFTVSVDNNPISDFRQVTNALSGFSPTKITVMAYNIGHYAYGTQNGYGGDDADDKIKLWKKFLAKYNVDICGLEEWQRYFDMNSTKDALADMWTPLYRYHAGLISSLFSTFEIKNTSYGYLGTSDPTTQRYYIKGYVNIRGKRICIMDVHLSPAITDAATVRANQIADLLNILENEEYFIVFGDFNVESSDEYNPFISAGCALANGGYLGWFNTHNPQNSTKYFDNIIVSPNIVVSNFEVLYDEYSNLTSDHYPLISELTVY